MIESTELFEIGRSGDSARRFTGLRAFRIRGLFVGADDNLAIASVASFTTASVESGTSVSVASFATASGAVTLASLTYKKNVMMQFQLTYQIYIYNDISSPYQEKVQFKIHYS